MKRAPVLMAMTCGVIAAAANGAPASAGVLDQVKQRGELICGSNPGLAGFGVPDDKGKWTGFDVDYCRAISAAIFGDPDKVKYVPLTAKDRFTALQTGEIDVLVRNTTWTMTGDTAVGASFTSINFYDQQAFMVRARLGVKSALELNGAEICVQRGTTNELNLADFFRAHKMDYKPVAFGSAAETVRAYDAHRCDVFTSDSSALYAERLRMTNPAENIVLPERISREPFAAAVRKGDGQWFDVVRWVGFGLVAAEEAGITKANVEEKRASDNPELRRMLGVDGKLGSGIGLPNEWLVNIVRAVGNYGEIYERNLGENSRLKIPRGQNNLWNKGGLMYAPPIR
ncbi:amino acid ABC transporter substrate-binding protein [Camelimonas fluminis]|uniref:Amino acid ABC transporter substrate-binding protein n=1 Tax=Camelimonas fluminis TaxID=1576911 RepID=A0ABV7UEQ9_9HYPH|nr:amino acid ABC transporter substrate-binding protein [Camelimonas fluminis]